MVELRTHLQPKGQDRTSLHLRVSAPVPYPTFLGRAAGNVIYGGTAHPPATERAGPDKPPPKGERASALPDNFREGGWKRDPWWNCEPTRNRKGGIGQSLHLTVRAPVLYPTILGGAAGNVYYGGTANPPATERAGPDKPPPTVARASALPDVSHRRPPYGASSQAPVSQWTRRPGRHRL